MFFVRLVNSVNFVSLYLYIYISLWNYVVRFIRIIQLSRFDSSHVQRRYVMAPSQQAVNATALEPSEVTDLSRSPGPRAGGGGGGTPRPWNPGQGRPQQGNAGTDLCSFLYTYKNNNKYISAFIYLLTIYIYIYMYIPHPLVMVLLLITFPLFSSPPPQIKLNSYTFLYIVHVHIYI